MEKKFKIIYSLLILFSGVLFFLGCVYLTGSILGNKITGSLFILCSAFGFGFSIFKSVKSGDKTFKIVSIILTAVLVVCSALFVVVGSLPSGNTAPTTTPTQQPTTEAENESNNEPEKIPTLFSGKEYKEGMYKVGTDIPAGEYCVTNTRGTGTFYVEVSADSSGNSIIANDNLELFGYVSLKDGEYIKINGGSAFAVEGVGNLVDFNNGRALMGIYKVGKDIPAGEYNVQLLNGASTGYYEVNSAPIGSDSDIITNDNITSNAYVTVSDGQYIKLSNCFISLK